MAIAAVTMLIFTRPLAGFFSDEAAVLAYVLAISLGVGPVGVFWSVFTADMLSCVVGVLVFRRGKWKTRTV